MHKIYDFVAPLRTATNSNKDTLEQLHNQTARLLLLICSWLAS